MKRLCLAFLVLALLSGISSGTVREIKVGEEVINLTSYIQINYSSSPLSNDSFKVPRLRLDIWSDPDPNWGYLIEIDPTVSPAIIYGWIDYKINSLAKIRTGKFYYPFGMEYTTPPSRFDTINPATVLWNYFGYSRDIGVQLIGEAGGIKYYLSFINGRDNEATDDNNAKDFCGRATYSVGDLKIGVSQYSGLSGTAEAERTRTGAELLYSIGPITLKSEFISGLDGQTRSQGWYFMPIIEIIPNLEAVVKCEAWDPDIATGSDAETVVTPGLNIFFNDDVKLQINYVIKTEEGTQVDNDQVMLQLQSFL